MVVLGFACASKEEADETPAGVRGAGHKACGGTCGGSPVGSWAFSGSTTCDVVPTSGGHREVEGCAFEFERGPDGVLGAQSVWVDFSGQPMTQATLTINPDGTYALGAVYRGRRQMLHAAECTQAVQPPASCNEVEALLQQVILGEGAGHNSRCMDDGSGGCLCTFDVAAVSGSAGTWQNTADGKLLLQPSYLAPGAPPPQGITYCASDTLALGPELLLPGQSQAGIAIVFERVDCGDGRQGPGEDGIDCGTACGIPCG